MAQVWNKSAAIVVLLVKLIQAYKFYLIKTQCAVGVPDIRVIELFRDSSCDLFSPKISINSVIKVIIHWRKKIHTLCKITDTSKQRKTDLAKLIYT